MSQAFRTQAFRTQDSGHVRIAIMSQETESPES